MSFRVRSVNGVRVVRTRYERKHYAVVCEGLAGISEMSVIYDRVSRFSGTRVLLIDGRASADFDELDGGRWVTFCVDHAEFVQHETRVLATRFLPHVGEWCESCMP